MKTTKNTKKTVIHSNSHLKSKSSNLTIEKKISNLVSEHRPAHTHIDENLYICINDVTLKRKYLLESLKSSLILQEEQDKIAEIREVKLHVLIEIRKEMEVINTKYQYLKKLLPNVKNIISYTEKELTELDSQIEILKKDIRTKGKEIIVDERTEENLRQGLGLTHTTKYNKIKVQEKQVEIEELIPAAKRKGMTKLERIQNNLKLIESKLKNI